MEQLRVLPQVKYRYTIHSLDSSELFLPDRMVEGLITGWHDAYISDAAKKLGQCPINHLYTNTLAYKQAIQQRFAQIKNKGWGEDSLPAAFIEWKYHQVRSWHHIENLAGDTLQTALLALSAAVNGKQLILPDAYAQQLRDELEQEFDWEQGVRSMPLLLAAFVQAFSELPLKRTMTTAETYSKRSFV